MDRTTFNTLTIGDLVRSAVSGEVYEITNIHRADHGPMEERYSYTAAKLLRISNAPEWELLPPEVAKRRRADLKGERLGEEPCPSENPLLLERLTAAMREADEDFERVGGSTRHHIRDCLLPVLAKHGLRLGAI